MPPHVSVGAYPDSPLDPTALSPDPYTDIGGAFFRSVYLDSPSTGTRTATPPQHQHQELQPQLAPQHQHQHQEQEADSLDLDRPLESDDTGELEQEVETINVTRPLHVRKKYPVSRRRPSVPRSPRSPTSPRTRSSRSSSLSHTVARYQLPSFTFEPPPPITMQPLPPPPVPTFPTHTTHTHVPPHRVTGAHAPARPPRTRRRSPSELHLGLGRFDEYDDTIKPRPSPPVSPAESPVKRSFPANIQSKPLPLPPSPLTPSRAPRKAASILGSGYTTPSAKAKSTSSASTSTSTSTATGPRPRTTSVKREHFRPLPSSKLYEIEQFFGSAPPKPRSKRPSGPSSSSPSTGQRRHRTRPAQSEFTGDVTERHLGVGGTVRHLAEDGSMWMDVEEEQEFAWLMSEVFATLPQPIKAGVVEVVYEGSGSVEDEWGMTAFTSVLDMKRVKARKADSAEEIPIKPQRPGPVKAASEEGIARMADGTVVMGITIGRSRSTSPSAKPKHRPPPLTLSERKPTNLPILTTGPSPSLPPPASLPDTPFAHPRAPPAVPDLPPLPSIHPLHAHTHSHAHHGHRQAPRPVGKQPELVVVLPEERLDVSFFEPVTPVATHRGAMGAVKAEGGKWLKRVKDLKI